MGVCYGQNCKVVVKCSQEIVPLCEMSSSLESVIVTSVPSTSSCSVTFSASSPIVLVQPFVSPNVPFAGEPSRKRRKENSGAVLISKEETWAQFQKCWSKISLSLSRPLLSPKDHPGPSFSHSRLLTHPARISHYLLASQPSPSILPV